VTTPRSKKPVSKVTSIDGARRKASGTTAEMLPDVQGLLDWVLRDPRLVEYCASAVDQFEVAARLETFGLSARVVRTSFGFSDVFAARRSSSSRSLIWTCGRKEAGTQDGNAQDLCAVRSTPYRRSSCRSSSSVFTSAPLVAAPGRSPRSPGHHAAFTVLSWSLRDRKDHRSDAVLAASSIVFTP